MNRGNLKTLIRLSVPAAKTNRVSSATLNLIIQMAVDDICAKLRPIRTDEKFNVTNNTYKYDLSSVITRFISIESSGLWWNSGTAASTDWTQVYPRTLAWLDRNRPSWRDLATGDPQWYTRQGDELLIVPQSTTSAALEDGFWLFFNQKSQRMGDDAHYPFGYTSQIERLAILDDPIIKYTEMYLNHATGKKQQGLVSKKEYDALLRERGSLLDKRLDVSNSTQTRLQGRRP